MQSVLSFNREIALALDEWAPVDENAIYAEEDAVGGRTAATDETSTLPSIPEAQEDQDGQDVIDNLSDCNTLQRAIEEDESASSSAEAVDSNVDGNVDEDINEGVDGAKAAEAMAVALAPLEGGYIALEGDMAHFCRGRGNCFTLYISLPTAFFS